MYEQVFSSDKENDERSFDEICDEALKLFKSQCDKMLNFYQMTKGIINIMLF